MIEELLKKILAEPNTIIALCSLIISIVAVTVSMIFAAAKIRHNKKSVQPIALIKFNDREEYISVDIRNVGIGSLIIKKLKVYKTNETKGLFKKRETKSNLVDWLPQQPDELSWSDFVEHVDVFTIPAGDKLFLIEMEFDDEHKQLEEKFRTDLRQELRGLTVEIEYEDIYKKKFIKKRSCEWFGRLLTE